jgi:shikimate kinase / 3-dehydroquinate synthase
MPPPERTSIVFTGFMGAGKSRAARAAAAALGREALDTDELIERRIGEPIAVYFEREGEPAFRRIEAEVIAEAVEGGRVVALGGGAVETESVRELLAEHVTVLCRVREEVAWERCSGGERPLAGSREEFGRRYVTRLPLYEAVARVVLPRGGDETPARAAPWLDALRAAPELRVAWARTASAEYPVVVGPGAATLADAPAAPRAGARLFGIVDPRAAEAGVGVPACKATIEAAGGEPAKTLTEAGRILTALAELGVRRDDGIVAVGGGVVGDLAGFCAAVYQRGVPVIQAPTTLVAQVDAAIGGKTGVDLPAAKNYVGAYHQPFAVLSDPATLESLPRAELAAGWAEVIKTALIAGGELWDRVRAMADPLAGEGQVLSRRLAPIVFDCALTKLSVVAEDERDGGRRAVLNLGHTVGHAIEAVSSYRLYRHGEAVALGLLAALRLSGQPELRAEVADLLAGAGLPSQLDPAIDPEDVVAATARDKKRGAGGLGFVVVEAPGAVEYDREVPAGDLLAAVEELRR